MAHKQKGQLTSFGEFHKHLRKVGKHFFWKSERAAQKKETENEVKQVKNIN